jgi:hypothetical protein
MEGEMKNHERRPDPTPSEIAEACREIQNGWTQQRRNEAFGVRDDATESPPNIYRIMFQRNGDKLNTGYELMDSEYWQWS